MLGEPRIDSIFADAVPGTSFAGYPVADCRKCRWQIGRLARYVYSNGRSSLRWQCSRCGDYGSFSDVGVAFLAPFGVSVLDLPVCFDASGTAPPCIVCGLKTTEFHHWAPTAIFHTDGWTDLGDWSSVGDYLCTRHHEEWHNRMRTHGLRWPSELAA